jgi:hypothetical protein
MRSTWRYVLAAVLAMALTTACEQASLPMGTDTSAVQPAFSEGSNSGSDINLVRLNFPENLTFRFEQVIGSKGGKLRMGPHELQVERGAVRSDTRFVVTVILGEYLVMDLKAFRVSDGAEIKVFEDDVKLKISYADLAWLGDPDRLTVVYLVDGTPSGRKEKVNSEVVKRDKRVTGKLKHFSFYTLGLN